ncbi:hypothetical protein SLNSH_18555 [Alsobacter soli]|uniref:Uncharacterized protein n=1 Tax=Alsobacter soli TaxID=2109933 RepID=A0A2T1HPF3_9HYPH|nr:hypothetical protein [Alsobacter soli]PSC03513.1 hypothetical protein SLNSH_18555 [Alsobacter soli]
MAHRISAPDRHAALLETAIKWVALGMLAVLLSGALFWISPMQTEGDAGAQDYQASSPATD